MASRERRPSSQRQRREQQPTGKAREKKRGKAAPSNPSDILNFLQPRETLRLIKARGGKRLVRFLRVLLPLAAAVVLAAILLWPLIHAYSGKSLSVAARMIPVPDLAVDHLRFSGSDSRNQPFSVTAERATRPGELRDVYDLDKPEGDITLKDGSWIAGKALHGRYDREGRKLWLGGDVQLFHDGGFQFRTNEANVDMNDSSAWGEAPVTMQGGFGSIIGNGFRMLDSGNIMVVKGPARAVLNLRTEEASGKQGTPKQ